MSLKSFHILFIVVSLGLMGFLTYWSGTRVLHGQDGLAHGLLVFGIVGLAAGVPYLGWFLRKMR